MSRLPLRLFMTCLVGGLLVLASLGSVRQPTLLEQVRQRGELVVGMRPGPSIYHESAHGPAGLEYDLVRQFADRLGVELRLRIVPGINALTALLEGREIDMVAAGITPTPRRVARFTFSKPFMQVYPQVIYRVGTPRPEAVEDLIGHSIVVLDGSSHEAMLRKLRQRHPTLSWKTLPARTTEELLYHVWSGRADLAVTDSNKLVLNQHYFPELRAAMDLGGARGIAWLFRPGDDGLVGAANDFLTEASADGTLARLQARYYGHLQGRFDYVDTRTFLRRVTERLPQYRETFKSAAEKNGLDWRLLAAMGFQESHWEADAVSPTGVRGLMMLTLPTAAQVGVENRLDPEQSIRGGARYLAHLLQRLPDHIPPPARTWFALAAYNVGLGHLEDARVITEMRGGDPNSWKDVKANLPLLEQKKWYSQVRYGYARGWQPVRYVEHIRRYYQLLVRITSPRDIAPESDIPMVTRAGGTAFTPALESAF